MKLSQLSGIAALAFGFAAAPALGAGYPERPVNIIVPFAAGGPTDAVARILAQSLQKQSGGSFLVENVPGAGTTIGAARAARAQPDGYTLFWGSSSSLAIAPHIYSKIAYDPLNSFDPVSWVASTPYVMVVRPDSPAKTIADLVARAKAAPGKMNYASAGLGSGPHVVAEMFLNATGISIQHIPYKGGSPAITAVISGDVDFYFDTPTTPIPLVKANRLRALAVTDTARQAELPDVPTMQESGLSGVEAHAWFALLAPHGTPKEIVNQLNKMVAVALKDPAVLEQMAKGSFNPASSTPEKLGQTIKAEHERWGKIIREKNIRVD
ncbi:MAG: Bug family tripartite tricarboxylate transporter substrate binding protein [Noviherbaspirillum sp.]